MKIFVLYFALFIFVVCSALSQITPDIQRQIDYILNEKLRIKPEELLKYIQKNGTGKISDPVSFKKLVTIEDESDARVDNSSYPMSEIHAAMNPFDSNNMVVSAIEVNTGNQTNPFSCPIYYTKDFGKSWTKSAFTNAPKNPNALTIGGGDPVFTFDDKGVAYMSWINLYLTMKGTSSYDSVFAAMRWAYSSNGGQNWIYPDNDYIAYGSAKFNGNSSSMYGLNLFPDKQWMASDISALSPYKGNVYTVLYKMFLTSSSQTGIYVVRKLPKNDHFDAATPVRVSGSESTSQQFTSIDVDDKGYVNVTYYGNKGSINSFWFTRSTNGGATFSTPVRITNFTFNSSAIIPTSNGANPDPVTGITTRRAYVCPLLIADKSATVNNGNLHFFFTADGISTKLTKGLDIYHTKSTNGGANWSTPKVISSNADQDNSHQFYSSAHINNLGVLSVGFYDSDPNNQPSGYTNYMIEHSYDGGDVFTTAASASTQPTYFGSVGGRNSDFGVGEYNATLMSSSYAIPFWADGRTNEGSLRVYCRKIPLDLKELSIPADIPVISAINADFRIVNLMQNIQSGSFDLSVYSDNEQILQFEIYDILGNLYKNYSQKVNAAGETKIFLNADNLKVGVYMLKVSNSNFYTTDKLIVK